MLREKLDHCQVELKHLTVSMYTPEHMVHLVEQVKSLASVQLGITVKEEIQRHQQPLVQEVRSVA